MKIPTIESRASNMPMDKGNYICCHNGSTDKDIRRICRSQYGHPGYAIGYWPKRCLGHVYIVLEPIGSARLTFDNDLYYMSYVIWWLNVVRSLGWDHGHDEECWNGREVKIYIDDDSIRTPEVFQGSRYVSGHRKGFRASPRQLHGLNVPRVVQTSP